MDCACKKIIYVVNGADHVVHCKGISSELNSLCDHELSHKLKIIIKFIG